jgi:hypothetical protein
LFRPGFWLDQFQAPFERRAPAELMQIASALPEGQTLRFRVAGQSRSGEDVDKVVRLTLNGKDAAERLRNAGLSISALGGELMVQTVRFGSQAAKYGLAAGDRVTAVLAPAQRIDRYWLAVPALILLVGVFLLQRRRRGHVTPALAAG